ncbi:hypothetical protein HYW94_02895 [Candidatus Uhrbacteria bacterium]|nr:hypothetical protein [Candidatus Uhrbacteria bacterium]
MLPHFDLDTIKFGTDPQTFERAIALYESGKVTHYEDDAYGCSAIVVGTHPYRVFVDARHYDRGQCDCYLGQKDVLCKHMVAVAIQAVTLGEPLSDKEKKRVDEVVCSGKIGELTKEHLASVKKSIAGAIRYIKAYTGPSRKWFIYQSSLCEGVHRLAAIICELPVSKQTAKLLIDLLLRLDHKLQFGTDDSDGTVGSFIYEVVALLEEYVGYDPKCAEAFRSLIGKETCFEWEEPLVRYLDEGRFR